MNEEQLKALQEQFEKTLTEKVPQIVDTVKTALAEDAKTAAAKKSETVGEKSVLRDASAGKLAWQAPFVTAGAEVKQFVKDFRLMAKGKSADFNEGNDEEGGYLVPEEVETAIVRYQTETGVFRKYGATIRSTKGDRLRLGRLDQSVNSFGGVVFSWEGEGDLGARTGAKFGKALLVAKKLMALTVMSNEFLQDSDEGTVNFIVQLFGEAAAYAEDLAFFNGDGTDRPLGILQTPGIQSVNRAVANQISYADVNSMFYKLSPSMRKNAVWFGNTEAIAYLDSLKDADGRPLFVSNALSLQEGGTPTRLKGLPFVELEETYLSALGVKGDLVLVDMSKYYILDKAGLMIDVSPHSRFEYDETEWRFKKRVDGLLVLPKAAVALDVPA